MKLCTGRWYTVTYRMGEANFELLAYDKPHFLSVGLQRDSHYTAFTCYGLRNDWCYIKQLDYSLGGVRPLPKGHMQVRTYVEWQLDWYLTTTNEDLPTSHYHVNAKLAMKSVQQYHLPNLIFTSLPLLITYSTSLLDNILGKLYRTLVPLQVCIHRTT